MAERVCDADLAEQMDSVVEVFGAGALELAALATGGYGSALAETDEEPARGEGGLAVLALLADAVAQAAATGESEITLDPAALDAILPATGMPPTFELFLSPAREPAQGEARHRLVARPARARWGQLGTLCRRARRSDARGAGRLGCGREAGAAGRESAGRGVRAVARAGGSVRASARARGRAGAGGLARGRGDNPGGACAWSWIPPRQRGWPCADQSRSQSRRAHCIVCVRQPRRLGSIVCWPAGRSRANTRPGRSPGARWPGWAFCRAWCLTDSWWRPLVGGFPPQRRLHVRAHSRAGVGGIAFPLPCRQARATSCSFLNLRAAGARRRTGAFCGRPNLRELATAC